MGWLQIVISAIICGIIILDVVTIVADVVQNNRQNNKYKTDCNSCALLEWKKYWGFGEYKYHCREHGSFNKPPIFCADCKKRSEEK